jgi:hypothetical protein
MSRNYPLAPVPDDLMELINRTVGAASMCWDHVERAGIFDSTRAKQIADSLAKELSDRYTVTRKLSDADDIYYDW